MVPVDMYASEKKVFIGKLPVMVKSSLCALEQEGTGDDECKFDGGGYFIIKGVEKVVVAQERSANNYIHVLSVKDRWTAEIRTLGSTESKVATQFLLESKKSSPGVITVKLPYVDQPIPLFILFRAYGLGSDKEIISHILTQEEIENDTGLMKIMKQLIEDSAGSSFGQEKAIEYIAVRIRRAMTLERKIEYVKENLQREILSHIEKCLELPKSKCHFLAYMTRRLLLVMVGTNEPNDRDHFANKRLDLAGPLLAIIFRMLFKKMKMEMGRVLQKAVEASKGFNISLAVKHITITNGLKYSLATGNWSEQSRANPSRIGVSQVLNRTTGPSALSHLRRVNTPIGKDGKLLKPRQIHNAHYGIICPSETPEGAQCGLVKNLSIVAAVSLGNPNP
jgi:DNA-directed RNA polymerase II subunit RPB2